MEQQLNQTGVEETTENTQIDKKNRKKMVVAAMCLVVIAILIFVLSFMKYLTPEMRGKVAYEPALFNTVLLGNLVDTDKVALGNIDNAEYIVSSKDGSYIQSVTGKKLSVSLSKDSVANELGNRKQDEKIFSKVAPGDTSEAYIPFTVTNGTTVEDDETNSAKKKNVAESDIRYTIHIITTGNLPLEYQLEDVNTGKVYSLQDNNRTDATMGKSKDYIVKDSTDDNVFKSGTRILKCNEDGAITVHQYKLLATWPVQDNTSNDQSKTDETTTGTAVNDLRYMKELENVEIRLEVESYVNYVTKSNTADSGKAEGVLVLQSDPVTDSYYQLPENQNAYAQKTVRYDNLAQLANGQIEGVEGKNISSYTFHVCNGESVAAKWDEGNKKYAYSGNFQKGDYKVQIAVPEKKANYK